MSGKKANGNTSKDGVMIQKLIHKVGDGSSYTTLTKVNYSDWALLMKVKLKEHALSSVIEDGDVDCDRTTSEMRGPSSRILIG
jgi:hypothetical protein